MRSLREKHGYARQQDLAERIGIGQGALSDIESNVTRDIKGSVLASLCRVLGTTAEYIVCGADTEESREMAELESRLLAAFRRMPPELRAAALGAVEGMAPKHAEPAGAKQSSA